MSEIRGNRVVPCDRYGVQPSDMRRYRVVLESKEEIIVWACSLKHAKQKARHLALAGRVALVIRLGSVSTPMI